jgi:phosphoglycerol transferase MdoB-like AlkP superfamily enzyme
MLNRAKNPVNLLKLTGLLLALYTFCRLLFYWFNHSYFAELGTGELLFILLPGLRFDLSVIVLSNALFILLYLLPLPFREKKGYRASLRWLFILVNSICLLANCVDLVYFQFTLKRTTADVFNFFGGEIGNDLGRLLPLFLAEYWYMFLIWLLLSWLLAKAYGRIDRPEPLLWDRKQYLRQGLTAFLGLLIAIIAYRGGFQLIPLSTIDAGEYTAARNVPLVVNTPFTILKTMDLDPIQPEAFFEDEKELKSIYNPVSKAQTGEFRPLNVFIIALESFSKEYVGAINGKGKGYTPFLDSLMGQSLCFSNAYSNGKTSIQGIPSIVAGIPSWMNEPYIASPYSGNQVSSLALLLKKKGYYTAFFHGGTNGTMGFDAFAGIAGYDEYFGRTEYNNEKDYDGHWGIWDEEFFQYTANTISRKKQPFFATLFTLTSHHPYPIPEKYKGKFPEGPLPIEKCIAYTDYSLRKFFETAETKPWFKNTLFVFSADHTGISSDPFFQNKVGNNTIPIFYYMQGSDLKGTDSTTTQQIDIQPSVLDYLNYPGAQFCLGSSVFDSTALHFAFVYNYGPYQFMQNGYYLEFNGKKATELYEIKKDSLLKNNLLLAKTALAADMEKRTKAIIQTYQQALINNRMVTK